MHGRCTAAPGWVGHVANILVDEMSAQRCEVPPQLFYDAERGVTMALHMDGLHLAGGRDALDTFRDELKGYVTFSGGDIHELGVTYERPNRLRTRFEHGTELQANPKYLDYVVERGRSPNSRSASPQVDHGVQRASRPRAGSHLPLVRGGADVLRAPVLRAVAGPAFS